MTTTRYWIGFVRTLMQRFSEDHCFAHAANLSYTALLALVPLMAVSLALLSAFPVFEKVIGQLQDFIFANFVPAAGEVVQEHVLRFASKVTKLTPLGIGFLVVSALLLMASIDKAFNSIWKVKIRRNRIGSFLVYWAVLTLGPLFIGVGLAVTSYLISLPLLSGDTQTGLEKGFLKILPFLLEVSAFVLLYAVVPNRRINLWHALTGALLAAVLFELAKKGFAAYVTQVHTYETVYGALATVPLFLIWVYVSWLIILLGAEFTRMLSVYRGEIAEQGLRGFAFLMMFHTLGLLWRAQRQGKTLTNKQLLRSLPPMTDDLLQEILQYLFNTGLVHRTDNDEWALSRDLADYSLYDLSQAAPYVLPDTSVTWVGESSWNKSLLKVLVPAHGNLRSALDIPLKDFFRQETADQSLPGERAAQ